MFIILCSSLIEVAIRRLSYRAYTARQRGATLVRRVERVSEKTSSRQGYWRGL
jgi:hypothetical protein